VLRVVAGISVRRRPVPRYRLLRLSIVIMVLALIVSVIVDEYAKKSYRYPVSAPGRPCPESPLATPVAR